MVPGVFVSKAFAKHFVVLFMHVFVLTPEKIMEIGNFQMSKVGSRLVVHKFPFGKLVYCSHNIYVMGLLYFVPANATAG